jgi:dihydrofolate reductase
LHLFAQTYGIFPLLDVPAVSIIFAAHCTETFMLITIVVAASENQVIGIGNALPWHLSDDLKFFKKVTLGKPVLMGRKTFESMGKALPGRLNIVLSRSTPVLPEGVMHFSSLPDALGYLEQQHTEELCIIGGGVLFTETLSCTDQVYLTRVHTVLEHGDAFFPELKPGDWDLVWEEYHPADDKHAYAFTFQHYKRKR